VRRWWLLGALLVPLAVRAGASSERELIGQLDREVIALKQKVRYLEERLGSCTTGQDPGSLYPELVQVFSGGPVAVDRKGTVTTVTLPADVLFSTNSNTLREESAFALDLLGTALKLHPDVGILLVGHTDSELPAAALRKLFPTNWELSYARALAVARALSERHGVPMSRITVAGRADQEPVTGNDTPEGRSTNRRVVAVLTPGVSK
jgi:chemotaxis protein MotB